MKILSFDKNVCDYFGTELSQQLKDHGLTIEWVHPKNLAYDPEAEVLISGRVVEDNLKFLPNLKMVIVHYTGLDGLDLPELAKRNISVMNTSAHGRFVAERAVTLLLALRSQLLVIDRNLRKKDWSKRYEDDRMTWHSIQGKKVAIYGYGVIGQKIGDFLRPYDVTIGVLSYKDRDFGPVTYLASLEALCEWCDILFVATPMTEKTRNSIDAKMLNRLEGKSLINVGRGEIVKEEDLYKSLAAGELAGFGSDVWYQYPKGKEGHCWPSKYPLHEFNQVVMTPHNGGFEATAREVRYQDVLEKIIAFSTSRNHPQASE